MYLSIIMIIISLISFQQNNSTSVSGYVYVDKVGIALEEALIEVKSKDKVIARTKSDKEGFYQFSNLLKGSYTISVVCEGFAKKTIDVELQKTEQLRLDMGLDVYCCPNVSDETVEKAKIKGTIKDINSNPVQRSTVAIYDPFESKVIAKTTTDSKGNYEFGFGYGQIVIIVSKPGYSSKSLAIDFLANNGSFDKSFDFVLQKLD